MDSTENMGIIMVANEFNGLVIVVKSQNSSD